MIFNPLSFLPVDYASIIELLLIALIGALFTPFCSPIGCVPHVKRGQDLHPDPGRLCCLVLTMPPSVQTEQLLVFCLPRQLRAVSGIVTPREALPVALTGAEVSNWLRQTTKPKPYPGDVTICHSHHFTGSPRPPACDQRPGFPIRGKSFTGMLALDLLAAGLDRWELLARNRSPDVCPFSNQSSDSSLLFL